MKTKKQLFIALVLVLTASDPLYGDTYASKPKEKDLIGAWIGCAWGCTEFFRLDLTTNGYGSLVILHRELEHDLYSLQWTITAEKFVVSMKPSPKAEAIEVKVLYYKHRYLELEIRGVTRNWRRTVTLYNEKDWNEGMRRSREASAGDQSGEAVPP